MAHSDSRSTGDRSESESVGSSEVGDRLPIANSYGNIELANGIPEGYTYVARPRMQPRCRRLGIPYVDVIVGFSGDYRFGYRPRFLGVAVRNEDASRLQESPGRRDLPQGTLVSRAERAWKSRQTRNGEAPVRPSSVQREQHEGLVYVVLRQGDDVLAEYEVRGNRLQFREYGPAWTHRQKAIDESLIADIPNQTDDAVVAQAVLCMHALNRLAKHLRGANRQIYSMKDEFLQEMVLGGRATAGKFKHTGVSREMFCADCGRSWVGDTYCYECQDDTGDPGTETRTWYLVDCGSGYRFHQPSVCAEVEAVASEIEAHDPTQPAREIPDIGMGVAVQRAYVREATRRLRALRGAES